jgi:hypothetical protein
VKPINAAEKSLIFRLKKRLFYVLTTGRRVGLLPGHLLMRNGGATAIRASGREIILTHDGASVI